ncbi:MAG: flagellar secretion chaperone FliS [Actinomycetota bacterium]|jgi:flagellar protein FliS|nr:flagellar secretion chaperone FliS [Actinomycetota bacterium]
MTVQTSAGARSVYFRDSVGSASPTHLLTMLYDRLLLDLRWAEKGQEEQDWLEASKHLMHAQAIITELIGTLKPELWEGAPALMSIYVYVLQVLRTGNARHDIDRTREGIALLEPLRQAWHRAAELTVVPVNYVGLSAVG